MKVVRDLSVTAVSGKSSPVAWDQPWGSPLTQTQPALVMDFAAGIYGADGLRGTIGSTLSLGRNSNGGYVSNAGALAIAGINQPRVTFDPNSLAPQGLLLEAGRTNLILNSSAPVDQDITVNAVEHHLSFYGDGSITLSGAHTAVVTGVAAYPDRTTVSFTPTAGLLTLTFAGDVTAPQLEEGVSASSYIATGGAPGVRDADNASVALGTWYDQSAGTLVFSGSLLHAAANDRVIEIEAGDNGTRLSVLWNSVLGKPQFQIWSGGSLQAAIAPTGNAIALGDHFRVAIAFAANDFAVSMNGAAPATDTAGTVPTPVDTLRLGRASGGAQGMTLVESVVHYASRLSNTELQALSA